MSNEQQRRRKTVSAVIDKLVADGATRFRAGDVVDELRARNQPMGTWEVRSILAALQADGHIVLDDDTATWAVAGSGGERKTG